jgi:hypothetical protein
VGRCGRSGRAGIDGTCCGFAGGERDGGPLAGRAAGAAGAGATGGDLSLEDFPLSLRRNAEKPPDFAFGADSVLLVGIGGTRLGRHGDGLSSQSKTAAGLEQYSRRRHGHGSFSTQGTSLLFPLFHLFAALETLHRPAEVQPAVSPPFLCLAPELLDLVAVSDLHVDGDARRREERFRRSVSAKIVVLIRCRRGGGMSEGGMGSRPLEFEGGYRHLDGHCLWMRTGWDKGMRRKLGMREM